MSKIFINGFVALLVAVVSALIIKFFFPSEEAKPANSITQLAPIVNNGLVIGNNGNTVTAPPLVNKPLLIPKGSGENARVVYSVITTVFQSGNFTHNYFNYVVYDTTQKKFHLKSKDLEINYSNTDTIEDNVEIKMSWGYDYEMKISRFELGEYKTKRTDSALSFFISIINNLLKNDFTGTSKIHGYIRGYADSAYIKKNTKYNGNLGFIQDEVFFVVPVDSSENRIPQSRTLREGIDKLTYIDFALFKGF